MKFIFHLTNSLLGETYCFDLKVVQLILGLNNITEEDIGIEIERKEEE